MMLTDAKEYDIIQILRMVVKSNSIEKVRWFQCIRNCFMENKITIRVFILKN